MFDITFLAAIAAALSPPLACWKWGVTSLKWVLLLQWMLFGTNLALSRGLEDNRDGVIEGQAAAFGLTFSIAVLIIGMAVIAFTRVAMRMLSPQARKKEGTER